MLMTEEELIPEKDLATQVDVKVATLRTWASRRKGPDRIVIARKVFYRQSAIDQWLRSQEQHFQ